MNKNYRLSAIALLLILALAVRLYLFQISVTHIPTTTDEALAMLIAKGIAAGERPLLFWGTPYQFPFESYILAPFYKLLPHNAFGARLILALLAAISVLGFCYLLSQVVEKKDILPGLLLLLFPSCYLFTLQSAYFIPEYTASFVYAFLLPLLTHLALKNERRWIWLLALGLCAGFALATHLLSLPLVLAVSIVVCSGSSFRNAVTSSVLYLPSLVVGFVPYLLTMKQAANQASTVTGTHGVPVAIERFFSDLLSNTLSVVVGVQGTSFPDFYHWGGVVPRLALPVIIVFWLLLGVGTILVLVRLLRLIWQRQWPAMGLEELFVGATWISLLAFTFSQRSDSAEYRYLLPVAWCFPFLVSFLYGRLSALFRASLLSFAMLLSTINVWNSVELSKFWQSYDFTRSIDLHPVAPVLSFLKQQGISHCYSSFWYANRLTYESDSEIICDQAYNVRFFGWPLPFRDEIDASRSVAYVLTNKLSSRFRADTFHSWLHWHRISTRIQKIPPYFVFYDFGYKGIGKSALIQADQISVTSSDGESDFNSLLDGNPSSVWQSSEAVQVNSWLRFDFQSPKTIHRLRIFFEPNSISNAPVYRVEVSTDGNTFTTIRDGIRPSSDRLLMTDTHPVLVENFRQDTSFEPVVARALRISVDRVESSSTWKLADILLSEDIAKDQSS